MWTVNAVRRMTGDCQSIYPIQRKLVARLCDHEETSANIDEHENELIWNSIRRISVRLHAGKNLILSMKSKNGIKSSNECCVIGQYGGNMPSKSSEQWLAYDSAAM